MMIAVISLFAVAIAIGVVLVVICLRARRGSLPLALAHAVAAVLGVAMLIWHIAHTPTNRMYNLAALLFAMALLGGMVLLTLRWSRREYRTPPPLFVVLMHAVLALFAFWLLMAGYTRGQGTFE